MPRRAAQAPEAPASAAGSDTGEAEPAAHPPLSPDQQQQLLRELHQLREQVAAGAPATAANNTGRAHDVREPETPPPHTHRLPSPAHSARLHPPDKDVPPAVDAVELSDDDDEEAEGDYVANRQHSSVSVASILDLLRGDERTLPLPHSPRNPYPRAPALQTRAGHYAPDSAGDSVHGKLHTSLQRIHKDVALELVRNELCTLVPVSSILYDLSEFLQDAAAMAAASPQLRGREAEQLLRAALQQLSAARELNSERIAELRGAVRGRSHRAAVADILYDQEATLVGAIARLEDLLTASTQVRTVNAHLATVARQRARTVQGGAPTSSSYSARGAAQYLRSAQPRQSRPREDGSRGGDSGAGQPRSSARGADAAASEGRGKGRGRGSRYGDRGGQMPTTAPADA